MTDYYPVVKVRREWAVGQEAMGTKSKFWYRHPEQGESDWLFKYPRENTGEHWAEKIAAEVAAALEIPHARVELAELQEEPNGSPVERGSTSESFLDADTEITHGNDILVHLLVDYDPELRFGQSQHTLKNISVGLYALFGGTLQETQVRTLFCEYLVFDAVVGNTDRHHENWAVQFRLGQDNPTIKLAPSFDHAASLGREILDDRRERILSGGTVGRYSERGKGGIYWSETDHHGASPLQLVRLAARQEPDLFTPALLRLESLELSTLDTIVSRVPRGWMSEASRKFAVELLYYNCQQLRQLLQEVS